MALKLFRVEVENTVFVLAEDEKSAAKFVEGAGYGDITATDALEGCWCTATEVTKSSDVDDFWRDSLPYVDSRYKDDEENDDIIDLTCGELIEEMINEEKEKLLIQEEEAKFDKLQMKFPFMTPHPPSNPTVE